MKSERQAKGLAIVAIVLAIGGLSIGFAAFSQTLNINGAATVEASNWDIHFENLSAVSLSGTAVEVTAPSLDASATTISNYDITLTTPGDSATYTFDVVNDGTFDALVTSTTIPTPTCTAAGDAIDATNVCNHLTYTLTYADDSAIQANDALAAGATANLKLTLTYDNTITAAELPNSEVTISGLATAIIYGQA